MAATVRVTATVTGVGPFGDAVRAQLAAVPAVADGSTLVVALWRPSPALCAELDERAFASGQPWLPVVADHPHVLAGPLVVPPGGPCYHCYSDRRAQHDTQSTVTAGLHAAYDADPELGPAGFLPHHVRVAAALAELVLTAATPGLIAAHHLATGQTTRQHVTGVHGCRRCDPGAEMGARDGSSLASYVRGLR